MRDINSYIKLEDGSDSSFTFREFITSQEAERRGIKLLPTEEQWTNIENLVREVLQPIRNKFGALRINSGFRSVELSNAIGSSTTSNHNYGFAADIEPYNPNIKLIEIINFIHKELDYSELIAEYFPTGWVHVAYNKVKKTKDIKLKDKTHNYSVVSLDELNKIYGVSK